MRQLPRTTNAARSPGGGPVRSLRSLRPLGLAPALAVALAGLAALTPACASNPTSDDVMTSSSNITATGLAPLALANVGGMACQRNSLGGSSFYSSCTGNGGQPEYWCADFAKWVWANNGVDVGGLTAAAGSFYVYGQNHGTLKTGSPQLGDAVVFNYGGNGYADHVAIVTNVLADGRIETASGDWNGQDGSEAQFSRTSHVVLNTPAYPGVVGSQPGVIGMKISGFISPAGGGGGGGGGSGGGGDCSVHADHKLYCSNAVAAIHQNPWSASPVVDTLRSRYSWFSCWWAGEMHAGGNQTWYWTQGDDNGAWGFVPAVAVNTPDDFDTSALEHGLPQCGQ